MGLISKVTTSGKLEYPLAAAALAAALPAEGKQRLAEIRTDLAANMAVWQETGYKYTGQIYREIAMENSNYGARLPPALLVARVFACAQRSALELGMMRVGVCLCVCWMLVDI